MIEWNAPRSPACAKQLRDLLHDCVVSTAADQAARLIEAGRLLGATQDLAAQEAMIACAAYECAALLVLGPNRPFMVSRGANGRCLASAVLADGREEATAEAATPALAILAAHIAALLADDGRVAVPAWRSSSAAAARLH